MALRDAKVEGEAEGVLDASGWARLPRGGGLIRKCTAAY